MWFTGKNYYNVADEKDRNFIFYDRYNHMETLKLLHATCLQLELYHVIDLSYNDVKRGKTLNAMSQGQFLATILNANVFL
jgi:hypothetical protein